MDGHAQILVHVGAPCTFSDDARYRQQAHGLLNFIHRAGAVASTLRPTSEELPSSPPSVLRDLGHHEDLDKEDTLDSLDSLDPHASTDVYKLTQHVEGKQGICNERRCLDTPVPNTVVQVGRTPAFDSRAKCSSHPSTTPVVIKETPTLHHYHRHEEQPLRFETPPSTVPDSQPSHGSFKRAFLEAPSPSSGSRNLRGTPDHSRKRARTESPQHLVRRVWGSGKSSVPSGASNVLSSRPPTRLMHGLDGVQEQSSAESSPSPSKRRRLVRQGCQITDYHLPQKQDQEQYLAPDMLGTIYEDEAARTLSSPRPAERAEASIESSAALQPLQNRQPKLPIFQKSSVNGVDQKVTSNGLTLAYAQPTSLPRVLPCSELLTGAPRPPTSTRAYTTHLTTALSILRARLQPLSKYYLPTSQARPIRPLERGFWHLMLPLHWPHGLRATFWRRLCDHVQRGKAGFGTRLERILDGQMIGSSQGNEAAFQPECLGREQWRVWCWGEVHVEIWLLLYVDSGKAIRGAEMEWRDGVEDVVVKM